MGIRSLKTASISTGVKRSKVWDQSSFVSNNSYESIATQTVGAGGASSITFSSIPSTYKHLQIRWMAQHTGAVTDTSMAVQLNADSGSNYTQHRMYATGGGGAAISATSTTFMRSDRINSPASASSIFGVGVIDLLDYTSTNKNKTIRSFGGTDSNGSGFISFGSGLWLSTASVNSITLFGADAGNLAQNSHFALYGIKG